MMPEDRARRFLRVALDENESWPRAYKVKTLTAEFQAVENAALERAAQIVETDGENNRGIVHPIDAARAARIRALKSKGDGQ